MGSLAMTLNALGVALVVTKLDGTAKGGILAAMSMSTRVPVAFIGVGEKMGDLRPFSPREFANALVGIDTDGNQTA